MSITIVGVSTGVSQAQSNEITRYDIIEVSRADVYLTFTIRSAAVIKSMRHTQREEKMCNEEAG